MLSYLTKFVLEQKVLVFFLGGIVFIFGIAAWQSMPIDAFPDVTNVQVMILTEASGLAPLEIERQITFPIEVEMRGLPRVREVRSLSRAGLSQVVIVFDDGVDIYFARQLVLEKLLQAKDRLPQGIEPELGPVSTGLGEIYQYVVRAGYYCPQHREVWSAQAGRCPHDNFALAQSDYSLTDLRTLQDWLIVPQLRRLRGVNEVNSFGGFVKQYHVLPQPELLLKYDISLSEVLETLETNNANVGGNYLVRGDEQLYIVSKSALRNSDDIKKLVLNAKNGTPVYLRDVAAVKIGEETRQGAVTQDGEGEVVIGMVVMLRGANSNEVVRRVRAEIPVIQNMLPPGVRINPFYDRTLLIESCVQTVSSAILQGALFVILVLFILLWDIRIALTVTFCLPLTTAITFLAMKLYGLTADMMSLGGLAIALGAVVDASIVVTENIVRHYAEKSSPQESRNEVAYRAVMEVARPIVFAILITVVVFLPLFTLESLEKKMFEPLALTMCFAMAASLVVALTVIAATACTLARRGTTKNVAEAYLLRFYQPLVQKLLHHPRWAWVILAILFVGMLIPLPFLGTEFLPALDEGAIAVNIVRLPSVSLNVSKEQGSYLEKRLRQKFPEIDTIVSKSGRAEIAEDPMGPEQTDMFIMLKPYRQWRSGRNKQELTEAIRTEMLELPGTKPGFSQPIALRVNELISGVKSDVAVKIFGEDLEKLKSIAEKVAPILGSVRGSTDIKIEQVSGLAQLEINLKREEMARHKLNAGIINLFTETAIGGKVVTQLAEGEKRFAVLVRFPEKYRANIPALKRILIPAPGGYQVPLGEITDIQELDVPAQIGRENGERRLLVECNIRGRDMGSFIAEAQTRLTPIAQDLPTGYRLDWGGQFENQERAMKKLTIAVPLSILLIAAMLFYTFGSFKSTLLVLLNLPFAIVGGLWVVLLLGIPLSVPAIIGFIALLGMAVENGTVLVSFFQELRAQGLSVYDAVVEGTRLRMRPILCTSLTTLLGLFPMLYASGAGAEIQRPLAGVIMGGLFTALVLVLLVFPALYLMFHSKEK